MFKGRQLIFFDECSFKMDCKPSYAWQPRGNSIPVYVNDYASNYSLCLAIGFSGPIAIQVIKGGYNQFSCTNFYKGLTEIIKKKQPNYWDSYVLFCDNLNSHTALTTVNELQKTGLRILFNAPYSPECNFLKNLIYCLPKYLY